MAREIIGYHIKDHHTGKTVGRYSAKEDQKKRARARAERLNLEYGAHRYSADPVWADAPAPKGISTDPTSPDYEP